MNGHILYFECFNEVKFQFPGSKPHVMKEMADRLYEEVRADIPRYLMTKIEYEIRVLDFGTALQTVPDIRGIKPNDRRPFNAE